MRTTLIMEKGTMMTTAQAKKVSHGGLDRGEICAYDQIAEEGILGTSNSLPSCSFWTHIRQFDKLYPCRPFLRIPLAHFDPLRSALHVCTTTR